MKKYLILLSVLLSTCFVMAQHHGPKNHEERAKMRAEHVAQGIQLTQEEQVKVEAIFKDEEAKMQQIINQPDIPVKQMKKEVRALRDATRLQLRDVIGPEKYTNYEKWFQDSVRQREFRNKVRQEQGGMMYQGKEEIRNIEKERKPHHKK